LLAVYGVGRGERRRRPAAERDHVDENAALPLEKAGQHGVSTVHRSEQVHLDGAAMQIERRILERAEHAGAGIVDPDVDAAEPILRRLRQGLDRLRIGHVGGYGERRGTVLAAFPGEPFEQCPPPCGDDDMGTGSREGEGPGTPDAARSTGDDDDGSVKVFQSGLPAKASRPRGPDASVLNFCEIR